LKLKPKHQKSDSGNCANARITISYKKKAPNIKFGFPSKKRRSPEVYLWRKLITVSMVAVVIAMYSLWVYGAYMAANYGTPYNTGELGMSAITALIILPIILRLTVGWSIKKHFAKFAIIESSMLGRSHFSKTWTEVPNGKYVEIPLFENLFLDYEAEGEFSKYLTEVKIREFPFKYITHRFGMRVSNPNEYLWRARFYFSKQPTEGKLEVVWR